MAWSRLSLAGVVIASTLGGCFNPWEAYEDPHYSGGSGKPLPEPNLGDLAEGVSWRGGYVAAGQRDRFAVRRCVYAGGLPQRCEVTVVGGRAILAQVPTYQRSDVEWHDQGKRANGDVKDVIEQLLGDEHVALTRLGVFGVKWPEEGVVTAKIDSGRIKLLVGSPTGQQQLVFEVETPSGVTTVFDHYVSERAPNLFGFWLMGNDDFGDRNNGFVAFRRIGPLQYQLVAWLPPLEPNLFGDPRDLPEHDDEA